MVSPLFILFDKFDIAGLTEVRLALCPNEHGRRSVAAKIYVVQGQRLIMSDIHYRRMFKTGTRRNGKIGKLKCGRLVRTTVNDDWPADAAYLAFFKFNRSNRAIAAPLMPPRQMEKRIRIFKCTIADENITRRFADHGAIVTII